MILLCAFVIAAGCSYLVYRVVGNRLAATQPKATQVIVPVADIKLGSVLRDADLTTAEMVGYSAQRGDSQAGGRRWPGRGLRPLPG